LGENYISRAVRMLSLAVVFLMAASAMPSAIFGGSITEDVSAAAEYYVTVGLQQDFTNWNPLAIDMVSDYVATYLMFSVLFQYDEDWNEVVFDLATGYYQVVNTDESMTTYINITRNAYFRNAADPLSTANQLTAFDVEFTFDLIMANPGGTWDFYLYNVTDVRVVDPDDPFQIAIDTEFTKATLIDDLVWIPILPMYQWEAVTPSQVLKAVTPSWLTGSGPFYFDDQLSGSWYKFTTAPNYHGATDYPGEREVAVDGIMYQLITDPSAMVFAINAGQIDCGVFTGNTKSFAEEVGSGASDVTKAACQEMGIIDIAINAVPMEFRTPTFCDGNPLLLDPAVREAIAMTMNKTFFVEKLMLGYPVEGDSVIDPGFWHLNVTDGYSFDPDGALDVLLAAGYEDSGDGIFQATDACLPVVEGWAAAGDRLSFRLEAPDTDPSYETIGKAWVGDASDGGVELNYETKAEAVMVAQEWYKCNYDIWIWAWLWSPEPLSNLAVWLASEISEGGNNCQMPMGEWWYMVDLENRIGYSGYDENLTRAQKTMDRTERQTIVKQLQQWVYDSYCEIPPFYPVGLYAFSDVNYVGWGDWEAHVGRSVTSDLVWLWFDLSPTGANQRPVFDSSLGTDYQAIVDDPISFTVSVHDPEGDEIMVNWSFGDGGYAFDNITGDTTVPTVLSRTHTYAALASDGLNMTVTAWDHNLTGITATVVYVLSAPDTVPTITRPIVADPADVAYIETPVSWSVGASDAESSALTFTWDWGDGSYDVSEYTISSPGTEVIDEASHTWSVAASYSVELFVWDGSILPGHNISAGAVPYEVIENTPPDMPTIGSISANAGIWVECVASSSDFDGDTLTFTWDFGGGAYNVTEVVSEPGVVAISSVAYMWASAGSYPVTVYVDDANVHNVSADVTAEILASGADVPPGSELLSVSPDLAAPGQTVTMNASALDTNSDPLMFYIEFGDGDSSAMTADGGVTTRQYAEFTHSYDVVDVYTATVWIDDGSGLAGHNITVSADVDIAEVTNDAPWLVLQSSISALYNRSATLTPTVCRDNDSDPLSVWYDWGDGAVMSPGVGDYYAGTHIYQQTGEFEVTVWADDGTGILDHNISASVTVSVSENLKPSFNGTLTVAPAGPYEEGATLTFTFVFKDYEGDSVNVTVDFGDGSDLEVLLFDPAANDWVTESVNHTYATGDSAGYTVTVTVDDGMMPFHSVKTWNSLSTEVVIEPPAKSNILLYASLGIALIAAIALIAFMLMRRRKAKSAEAPAGMEGMKPEGSPPAQ